MTATTTVLILSFALGGAFGALSQKTHFCTMGAVADIINMEDWSRMRMWLLAIAIAILGSAALHGAGLIDLGKSIYRTPTLTWLSHLIGGLFFGIGNNGSGPVFCPANTFLVDAFHHPFQSIFHGLSIQSANSRTSVFREKSVDCPAAFALQAHGRH